MPFESEASWHCWQTNSKEHPGISKRFVRVFFFFFFNGFGSSLQLGEGQLTVMGFTSSSASVAEDVPVDACDGLVEYALEPLLAVALGVQASAMVEESRALGLFSKGGFGEMGMEDMQIIRDRFPFTHSCKI